MPKVLITTSSFAVQTPELLEELQWEGLDVLTNPYGRKLTENEVSRLMEEHQPVGMIAGVEPLTDNAFEKAPRLRAISRCGIGLDSVDVHAARRRGIAVTNTPEGPTKAVGELTLGLILTMLRKIQLSDGSIRNGGWQRPMGNLLNAKTVGIVGCGRIGMRLMALLAPFECKILGHDIERKGASALFTETSLDGLLADSDVVSLHLPYSGDTHHIIDEKRLSLMKPGAFLVNAARGGLVDEKALHKALQSHLAGAALDCFEQEPYTGPLRDLDNVVLTAHIGSYAGEARTEMERQAVENLLRSLREAGVVS